MPDTKTVFSKLFSTLQLSEPQFKSVVVLFRQVVRARPPLPPGHSTAASALTQHSHVRAVAAPPYGPTSIGATTGVPSALPPSTSETLRAHWVLEAVVTLAWHNEVPHLSWLSTLSSIVRDALALHEGCQLPTMEAGPFKQQRQIRTLSRRQLQRCARRQTPSRAKLQSVPT